MKKILSTMADFIFGWWAWLLILALTIGIAYTIIAAVLYSLLFGYIDITAWEHSVSFGLKIGLMLALALIASIIYRRK